MSLIEKPLRVLANVLAHLGKVSALHPIHTLIITSLFASLAYLSIVNEYINEGFNYSDDTGVSNLINYYHSNSASDSWSLVSDLSTIPSNVDHYNVIPYQFKRVGDFELPIVDGSFSDIVDDDDSRFVIVKQDEFEESEISSKQLVSKDGTVWKFRNYHTKIGKISDSIVKSYEKFISLINGAEPFDITLVTLAYLAMWYTFITLFIGMKKIGSNFWLAFSTLISSFFAFLYALYVSKNFLKLSISIISLTEGIPFLVSTIGFKHKLLLAQKVLSTYSDKSINDKNSSNILFHALQKQGVYLLRDHLLVITAFIGCSVYASHLEGLKNFCIFAALILAFDILTTFTFLSGIFSLKLEINIIHRATILKQALQEDGLLDKTVDDILKSNNLNSGVRFNDSTKSSSLIITIAKISSIVIFIGLQIFGLGLSSAWLSDISVNSNDSQTILSQLISKGKIPKTSSALLLTIYPSRFFLPQKVSIQIEDAILSSIGQLSSAIRDKFISKFLFFAFTISVSINVYLLNAARIHTSTVDKYIELQTPIKKQKEQQERESIVSKETTVKDIKGEEFTKSSEIISISDNESPQPQRSFEQIVEIYQNGSLTSLQDEEIVSLVTNGKLALYALEKQLKDTTRAVLIRRKSIAKLANADVLNTSKLPYLHYDYDRVYGACCENVIGFIPIPVGVAGPLIIDGKPFHIPIATTEGCLVASAMRGCKAINSGGGVSTVLTKDGMTRGPCVSFPSLARAGACKIWLDSEEGQKTVKKAFDSTSRFARLQHVQTALAGDLLFIRFRTTTGDAMGMNMISKGVEFALKQMIEEFGFDDMKVVSVSGNYCSDKKPAAINWIEGRGKSVVAEAIIPKSSVVKILKSDVKALVELNINKNLIGSALAGSIGGFNAHAANLLTALFLATGQDPAQNVESSNCMTLMKETAEGDLQVSVSMPSIEVGTIGGGTILDPQGSMLELLGVRGPANVPGENARQLAKVVASIVLAGELSLLSALAAGHLVQSHMTLNRAKK